MEIPVNLLFNIQAGNGNFFLGAGPYFAYGIYGKDKLHAEFDGEDVTDLFEFGEYKVFEGEHKYYDRKDIGINLLVGYEFSNGLFLKTGYSLGLKNISDNNDENNRCFDISIGYKF